MPVQYMKNVIAMIVAVILISLAGYLLQRRLPEMGGVNVYSGDRVVTITDSGSLKDLLSRVTDGGIKEVLVFNPLDQCFIIPDSLLSRFVIEKGKNYRILREKDTDNLLIGITAILVQTHSAAFGIYHLSYTEEKSFLPAYQSVRERIIVDNNSNEAYQTGVLSLPFELFIDNIETDSVLFVYDSGEEEWNSVSAERKIPIKWCHLFPCQSVSAMKSLKGVWENPPVFAATQIHGILNDSAREKKTLAIFVDGLGYHLWNYAKANGYTATFPRDIAFAPMRAVYPPKTVYNYYTFGTGELLPQNSNSNREIFRSIAKSGLKGIIIEGEKQIYNSSLRQQLHPRNMQDGTVDDRIFQTALKVLADYDFVFVHFHDIDDTAHQFGPYSKEVLTTIEKTGKYLNELSQQWKGNLFIFSDHGLHQVQDNISGSYAGTHYTAKAEDIIAVFADLSD